VFVEEMASLNLVERNDDIFEENDVLFSERNSKTRNDAGQYIKKFRSSVELECFMDETIEAIVDSFSDHFSSRDQLSIESVENIFQILSFSWFL